MKCLVQNLLVITTLSVSVGISGTVAQVPATDRLPPAKRSRLPARAPASCGAV